MIFVHWNQSFLFFSSSNRICIGLFWTKVPRNFLICINIFLHFFGYFPPTGSSPLRIQKSLSQKCSQSAISELFLLGFPLLDFDGVVAKKMMIVWQGAHIPVSDACRLCFTNILLILLGSFYRDPKTPHALASIPFCPSVLLCWDAESLGGLPWGARTVIFLILTVCCSSRSLSLISPFQRKSQEEIKSYDYPLLLSLKATRLSFSRRDCVTNITHIPRSSP